MKKSLLVVLSLMMVLPSLFAMNGEEIAREARNLERGDTSHMAVQMDLIEADGTVSSRLIEEWSMDPDNGDKQVLMVFRAPASVKNTRFLQVAHDDRDDDKWIYLPALRRVRRIASSDGGKSFMGSDATYDDMSTREVEEDNHELIGEETFEGWNCYVLKAVPADADNSQYSFRKSWIDKETFVPVKMEMYDSREELLKVMVVENLEQVNGYWTPLQTLLTNVQTGHATRLTIKNVEYDKPLDERLFSTSFLQNGR